MLHLTDIPILTAIIAAVLVPEVIHGFARRPALVRLAILFGFCVLATYLAFVLQHADIAVLFTRVFLIAITSRLSLLLNHIAEATLKKLDKEKQQQEGQA